MDWRKEYFDCLCNADIDGTNSILKENKPEFIYRYRPPNECDFDVLESDDLWFSNLNGLNDRDEFSLHFNTIGFNAIDHIVKNKLKKVLREVMLLSCFTENRDCDYFWEKYSDKNQGFCIVYKFEDVLKWVGSKTDTGFLFSPVKYGEKRHFNNLCDKSDTFAYAVYEKKGKWEIEKEWRILYTPILASNNTTWAKIESRSFKFITPHAVIMGYDMVPSDKLKLSTICEKKGIIITEHS